MIKHGVRPIADRRDDVHDPRFRPRVHQTESFLNQKARSFHGGAKDIFKRRTVELQKLRFVVQFQTNHQKIDPAEHLVDLGDRKFRAGLSREIGRNRARKRSERPQFVEGPIRLGRAFVVDAYDKCAQQCELKRDRATDRTGDAGDECDFFRKGVG
ncbi:MAG: hypothetical protein IPK58_24245 [Acidobacteria bacterium]|nr:hypothetical protein [Acidobacteriota bacterium]